MAEEHLKQVLQIERTVFSDPWSLASFRNEVNDTRVSFTRVALSYPEGTVVGYFVAWFVEDEVHLGNLAVASDRQHRGVGQQLLDHLLEASRGRGARRVTLEVRESNLVAQRLYLRNGFRPVAVRHRYYPDNHEDAIVMMLELTPSPEPGGRG
jgi:[ribosomal protein S18]-alanine N-acetyltransferase